VLVVAGFERNPTAPDGTNAPSLAPSKELHAGDIDYQDGYDVNNDDTIRLRSTGGG
jgi:hypothetical protein